MITLSILTFYFLLLIFPVVFFYYLFSLFPIHKNKNKRVEIQCFQQVNNQPLNVIECEG